MEVVVKQVLNNKKNKKTMYWYFLLCILVAVTLALNFYVDVKVIIGLLLLVFLGEVVLIVRNFKQNKIDLNEKISIDENGVFNYHDQLYQCCQCKYIAYSPKTVMLYFDDVVFVFHYHLELDNLRQWNNKKIKMDVKQKSVFVMLILLAILVLYRIFANIIGLFYVLQGYQLIDLMGFVYDFITVVVGIGAFILVKRLKKHQMIIYGLALVIGVILIFVPTISYFDDVAVIKKDQEIIVYNNVKYHYGKSLDVLSWQVQNLDRYQNILYGKDNDGYVFYDLENTKSSFEDFLSKYENDNFITNIGTITIENNQIKIGDEVIEVKYLGKNMLYLNYQGDYLLKAVKNGSLLYDLSNQCEYRVMRIGFKK